MRAQVMLGAAGLLAGGAVALFQLPATPVAAEAPAVSPAAPVSPVPPAARPGTAGVVKARIGRGFRAGKRRGIVRRNGPGGFLIRLAGRRPAGKPRLELPGGAVVDPSYLTEAPDGTQRVRFTPPRRARRADLVFEVGTTAQVRIRVRLNHR